MKAAFLIRCSTKNQDLDRQTRDLTRLAKSLGYEYDIENLVFGEKITGKDDVTIKNRESIDKLLRAAKEQKFDVVLVAEVSRMSRDPASGRVYVRQLINMSIPVYFRILILGLSTQITEKGLEMQNKLSVLLLMLLGSILEV